jgi:hypothetical protein
VKLILVSLGLLMVGVALVFLIVIHLLKPSFVLSFLAYAMSLTGLVLGVSSAVQHGNSQWRGGD